MEEIIKIAEEEIKRTSEEAVKAALAETGGELAFETARADEFEKENTELELYNKELCEEVESLKENNKKKFLIGTIFGGTGGIILTSIVYSICSVFTK